MPDCGSVPVRVVQVPDGLLLLPPLLAGQQAGPGAGEQEAVQAGRVARLHRAGQLRQKRAQCRTPLTHSCFVLFNCSSDTNGYKFITSSTKVICLILFVVTVIYVRLSAAAAAALLQLLC